MDLFFSPSGRIHRLTWWLGQLLLAAVTIFVLIPAIDILGVGLTGESSAQGICSEATSVGLIATLAVFILSPLCIWANICLSAKRFRDRNKSVWWSLAIFVPIVGLIWQIIECGLLVPGNNALALKPSWHPN